MIQLSKRGHTLDKAISENITYDLFLFEVELLLKECYKRGSKSNEVIEWTWGLVYRAKFNGHDKENGSEEFNLTEPHDISDLGKIIKSRRSIRRWKENEINVEEIIKAIDLAKWAPCSCNRQLCSFLIIKNEEDKSFLQIFTNQSFYEKAPLVIVPLVNISEYYENEKHYAYLDMGAIIQNLLLILHSEGLGACWMGIKKSADISKKYEEFRNRFKIDKSKIPVSIIPVGYPEKIPNPPGRKNTKDLILLR
jgi:nitroreductase